MDPLDSFSDGGCFLPILLLFLLFRGGYWLYIKVFPKDPVGRAVQERDDRIADWVEKIMGSGWSWEDKKKRK